MSQTTAPQTLISLPPLRNVADTVCSVNSPGHQGWAFFLDFDGTLAEFASRPEDVHVDPDIPVLLNRLHISLEGALAVVSGRPIESLDDFLAPATMLPAAGIHGLEQRFPGAPTTLTTKAEKNLQLVKEQVADFANSAAGVLLDRSHLAEAPSEHGLGRLRPRGLLP